MNADPITEYELALKITPAPPLVDDPGEDDGRLAQREAVVRLLQFLAPGRSPAAVGKRLALVAFAIGASPCRTQRELAAWCGVSEARVSAAVKLLRKKIPVSIED